MIRTRISGWRSAAVLLGGTVLLASGPAGALTLDWDLVTWATAGTRTQTYTVGSGDVIVTVTEPAPGIIDAGAGPSGSPASIVDGAFLDPTGNGGAENLFLKTQGNTAAPWVDVTIDFTHAGGVTDVAFSLFDIDHLDHIFPPFLFFGYTDEITVTGTDGTTTYDPASVTAATATPTWIFDGANTLTGTSSAPQSGAGSDDGTAQLSFDQVINRLQFQYKNTLANGQSQWIGLSSIVFRQAPEPSSGLLLGFGLLLLAGRRRRQGSR